MKKERIALNLVRSEYKVVNECTIGNCLTVLYSLINAFKEKQRENALNNEQVEALSYLIKVLPVSKSQAKKYCSEIETTYNIGGTRIVNYKNGPKEVTIRPSVDMVLRFFTKKYNEAIPEANLKPIKHECPTKNGVEVKKQKVDSANNMN